MPSAPPIITTKLYIPLLRPDLAPRPRLVDKLSARLDSTLTIVSTLANFGTALQAL